MDGERGSDRGQKWEGKKSKKKNIKRWEKKYHPGRGSVTETGYSGTDQNKRRNERKCGCEKRVFGLTPFRKKLKQKIC